VYLHGSQWISASRSTGWSQVVEQAMGRSPQERALSSLGPRSRGTGEGAVLDRTGFCLWTNGWRRTVSLGRAASQEAVLRLSGSSWTGWAPRIRHPADGRRIAARKFRVVLKAQNTCANAEGLAFRAWCRPKPCCANARRCSSSRLPAGDDRDAETERSKRLRAYILQLEEYIRNGRAQAVRAFRARSWWTRPEPVQRGGGRGVQRGDCGRGACDGPSEPRARERKPRKAFRIPPELPRVEVIHDLPEDEKVCRRTAPR